MISKFIEENTVILLIFSTYGLFWVISKIRKYLNRFPEISKLLKEVDTISGEIFLRIFIIAFCGCILIVIALFLICIKLFVFDTYF